MPGKVKVRVVAGRSLPVMDRSNDTTDAYVEVKLGQVTYKTDVCRKSLHPQWNSEWFKFEMDDLELQDEPLQIRLMDYDTYSANDAIGKVYLDLNPLLINSAKTKDNWGRTISGWLPVYDTMHGLRGEVNLIVKVELFSDLNKYRQSSCGVRVFFSPRVPEGFVAHSINGFVEELVINDDPEYQWIDKIRTPRATNEARQTLFQKLSGEVQRKVGLKTLELGGNAVVGYKQCIDLEGESGLVIRGIGTAMYLTKLSESQLSPVPMGSVDGATKESDSLCLQHSLPRKRKQTSSPSVQRRCRHPHPLPSMPNLPASPIKASPPSSRDLSRLSSNVSNIMVRNKTSSSLSPPSTSADAKNRGRSASPPKSKLKSTTSTSSLHLLTTTGVYGRISPNTLGDDNNKREINDSLKNPKLNEDGGSQKNVQKKNTQSSFSAAKANQHTKEFIDKDRKDICGALLLTLKPNTDNNTKDNFDSMRDINTYTKQAHSNLLSMAPKPAEREVRYLADMESGLDLELVASGGDTLSEISEERESQESFTMRLGPSPPLMVGRRPPRPLSLSEKESDDCSVSDDSPPTSPTSTTSSKTNTFTLLNLRKKHRWMTRRERLSTNCLLKRASSNPGPPPTAKSSSSNSSSTTKIREELGKIFKRISFSTDGEIDSTNCRKAAKKLSPTKVQGPYRTPRRLFFRRRRTRSRSIRQIVEHRGSIVRSNSECESHSLSLRQTSSESLPSMGSEPPTGFNFLDDYDDLSLEEEKNDTGGSSSLLEIPTYLAQRENEDNKDKKSKTVKVKETSLHQLPTSVAVDHSKLRELIGDLGYDTGKPLKLYISSMDALLVYDPAYSASSGATSSSSCVCLKTVDSCSGSGAAAADDPALHGLNLDLDTSDLLTPKIREQVDNLLRRAGSSVLNLEERATATVQFQKSKRHRSETLVECNSSTSSNSSGSITTSSGGGTSTTSSSGSGGCTTSATSSSCTKGFNKNMGISNRRMKLRRSDDEQVDKDLELENDFKKLENFVRSSQKGVGSLSGGGGVIAIGSGCRSPIPEESSSCETPVSASTTTSVTIANSSPKRAGSPQKQIPFTSTANCGGGSTNGFYGDHQESRSSGHVYNGGGSGASPEKVTKGAIMVSPVPNKGHAHYGQMHRRSSESDLSTTPKGGGGSAFPKSQFQRPVAINVEPIRGQEFPFITLSSQFPEGMILYLGGTVTARSVKLLKSIGNFEDPSPETRDSWWNELRIEMRSHCRAFGCNILLDYEEKTTMWDEVAILSASGTAAIIATTSGGTGGVGDTSEVEGTGSSKDHKRNDSFSGVVQLNTSNGAKSSPKASRGRHESDGSDLPCSMLHIPQGSLSLPTIIKKTRCAFCRKGKVPDVILASIDLPPGLHTTGRSCLIQTQVFRSKKESKGEVGAKEMSDSIPFLEYELHRRLINKLKVKGMNAIFGYKVQITQGDKVVVGVATGTAVFLTALPVPTIPTICAGNLKTDSQKVAQFQKVIQETFEKNREIFGVKNIVIPSYVGDSNGCGSVAVAVGSNSDAESDEDLDIGNETKDTFVLEVDDAEDIDIITMLIDPAIPVGYNMSNIETLVGFDGHRVLSQQMFNQVWRCKIPTISQRQMTTYFERLIRLVSFKLRRLQPCIFARMLWTIDLPESDEMQICVIGMALGLDSKVSQIPLASPADKPHVLAEVGKSEDPDTMFTFDEDKLAVDPFTENLATDPSLAQTTVTPPQSAGLQQKPSNNRALPPGIQTKMSIISASSNASAASTNIALNVSQGHGSGNPPSILTSCISNMPLPVSKMRHWVEISPLSVIPGARIERYLGNLNFYFIRETSSLREVGSGGGVNTFVHALFTDFLAIVRAHVSALGGNAIVSYFMTRCDLSHNPHKNQGQCVINVGGDAVYVTYPMGNHPEDGISIS